MRDAIRREVIADRFYRQIHKNQYFGEEKLFIRIEGISVFMHYAYS